MTNIDKENKLEKLQILEQNIQNLLIQKQQFQQQLMEIDSALEELQKAKGQSYKIIGAIMVASKKDDLISDLHNKKEILELRIKTIEKAEKETKEKASNLQAEVLTEIKTKEGK